MANLLYNLTKGHSVEIGGETYLITGLMELRQGNFYWKEFALKGKGEKTLWLSTEKDDTVKTCMLYQQLSADAFTQGPQIHFEGQSYRVFDSGSAKVLKAYGVPDTEQGDQCEFWEYVCDDDATKLLSIEKWEDGTECSSGKSLPIKDIHFPETQSPYADARKETPTYPLEVIRELSIGQHIFIKGKERTIIGMANMKQESFKWKEYSLSNGQWFCVEGTGQGDYIMSLHTDIPNSWVHSTGGVIYKDKKYTLVEKGTGIVTSFKGNVDYDPREQCQFEEYEAEDGSLLSVEIWSDGTESSTGEVLSYIDVEVLDKVSRVPRTNSKEKIFNLIVVLTSAGVIFFVAILPTLNLTPTIAKQLMQRSSFEYVTTVTLTDGRHTKSQVYRAVGYTLDSACAEIIKMDPERIKFANTVTDIDGGEKMVKTTREVVLIYESEEGEVLVQVTPVSVPSSSYNYYRPRYRVRLHNFTSLSYDWEPTSGMSLSGEDINTSYYYQQIASARQESINARDTTGGGTGFGK